MHNAFVVLLVQVAGHPNKISIGAWLEENGLPVLKVRMYGWGQGSRTGHMGEEEPQGHIPYTAGLATPVPRDPSCCRPAWLWYRYCLLAVLTYAVLLLLHTGCACRSCGTQQCRTRTHTTVHT